MDSTSRVITRILPALVFLFPIIFLTQVFILRPYFGNMDDTVLLNLVANTNPLEYAQQYGWIPGAGVITVAAMLVTWPAYALGSEFGPTVFFAVNSLVVFCIIVFAACALQRLLKWKSPLSILAFTSIVFLWPFTSDLFFFPSLQEKGIILGAAALFYWISFVRTPRSALVYWSSLIFVSLIAFTTKPHIVLFIPAAIGALWISGIKSPKFNNCPLLAGTTVLWLGLSGVILWLAFTGSYTSGTQGTLGLDFLTDRRFQLLTAIAFSYTVYLLFRLFRNRLTSLELIPLLLVIPFVASFAVWEVRNYYLATASVGVAAIATAVLNNWRLKVPQILAVFAVLALSIAWLSWRIPQVYEPLASVAKFLESQTAKEYSQQGAVIGVSCEEAPTHFNRYAQWLGVAGLQFEESIDISRFDLFLADSRLCPVPTEVVSWTPAWKGLMEEGYVLYERPN